jgi:hypothetical protein
MRHHCTNIAFGAHYQRIISALPVHYQCIVAALPLHCHCKITARPLRYQCIIAAFSLRVVTASSLHCRLHTITELPLHCHCSIIIALSLPYNIITASSQHDHRIITGANQESAQRPMQTRTRYRRRGGSTLRYHTHGAHKLQPQRTGEGPR